MSHRRSTGDEVDRIAIDLLDEILLPNGWEKDPEWYWAWRLKTNRLVRINLSLDSPCEISVKIYAGFYRGSEMMASTWLGQLIFHLTDSECGKKILAWAEEVAGGQDD